MKNITVWKALGDNVRKRAELVAPDFVRITIETYFNEEWKIIDEKFVDTW